MRTGGGYRVWAEPRRGGAERLVGEAEVSVEAGGPPLHRPRVAGPWRLLFRPERAGSYVNDHAIFRDAHGRHRLLGITGPGRGDYSRERRFAQGVSEDFPPSAGMREDEPVADFEAFRARLIGEIGEWEGSHPPEGHGYRYYERWRTALERPLLSERGCTR